MQVNKNHQQISSIDVTQIPVQDVPQAVNLKGLVTPRLTHLATCREEMCWNMLEIWEGQSQEVFIFLWMVYWWVKPLASNLDARIDILQYAMNG